MSELTSEQHDLVMETLTDRRVQKQLAAWKRYKEHNGISECRQQSSCANVNATLMARSRETCIACYR